jgi:hypothetical protein
MPVPGIVMLRARPTLERFLQGSKGKFVALCEFETGGAASAVSISNMTGRHHGLSFCERLSTRRSMEIAPGVRWLSAAGLTVLSRTLVDSISATCNASCIRGAPVPPPASPEREGRLINYTSLLPQLIRRPADLPDSFRGMPVNETIDYAVVGGGIGEADCCPGGSSGRGPISRPYSSNTVPGMIDEVQR